MDVTIEQKVGKSAKQDEEGFALQAHVRSGSTRRHRTSVAIVFASMTLKWSSRLTRLDTLKATISGGTIEHGCIVSGKKITGEASGTL